MTGIEPYLPFSQPQPEISLRNLPTIFAWFTWNAFLVSLLPFTVPVYLGSLILNGSTINTSIFNRHVGSNDSVDSQVNPRIGNQRSHAPQRGGGSAPDRSLMADAAEARLRQNQQTDDSVYIPDDSVHISTIEESIDVELVEEIFIDIDGVGGMDSDDPELQYYLANQADWGSPTVNQSHVGALAPQGRASISDSNPSVVSFDAQSQRSATRMTIDGHIDAALLNPRRGDIGFSKSHATVILRNENRNLNLDLSNIESPDISQFLKEHEMTANTFEGIRGGNQDALDQLAHGLQDYIPK